MLRYLLEIGKEAFQWERIALYGTQKNPKVERAARMISLKALLLHKVENKKEKSLLLINIVV